MKFQAGDIVVAKVYERYDATMTNELFSYVTEMRKLANNKTSLMVSYQRGDCVYAGNFSWHPEDLDFFKLDLENK